MRRCRRSPISCADGSPSAMAPAWTSSSWRRPDCGIPQTRSSTRSTSPASSSRRPAGPLADMLPGYEHRESQLQMLLAVAQIQQRSGTLVVEAGTGTGKSLAYLVPSIARAVSHRERVVVSTNTHTLQEQLMGKDLS